MTVNSKSLQSTVHAGMSVVPQGPDLEPLLFLLYIQSVSLQCDSDNNYSKQDYRIRLKEGPVLKDRPLSKERPPQTFRKKERPYFKVGILQHGFENASG